MNASAALPAVPIKHEFGEHRSAADFPVVLGQVSEYCIGLLGRYFCALVIGAVIKSTVIYIRKLPAPPPPPESVVKVKWGEPTWYLFHTLAEKINDESFPTIREELLNVFYSICSNLPCPESRLC